MNPKTQFNRIDQLQDAFQTFNRLSQNLTDSYQNLESRAACFTQELVIARHVRLNTLSEKERLGVSPRILRYKITRIHNDGVALPC